MKKIEIDLSAQHKIVQAKTAACPTCGDQFDAATGGMDAPRPGSLGICITCGEMNKYTAAPGGMALETITHLEFAGLPVEVQIKMKVLQAAIRQMKRYKR